MPLRSHWRAVLWLAPLALLLSACGAASATAKTASAPAPALFVSLGLPANGSPGTSPVTFSLSEPVGTHFDPPRFDPSTPGTWTVSKTRTVLTFHPTGAWAPGQTVAVTVPTSLTAADGARPLAPVSGEFSVGYQGTTARLQQLLADLGYLPVVFHPTQATPANVTAQDRAVFDPPSGSFSWRWPGAMTGLESLWKPDHFGVITKGAVMQFQRANGLTPDGLISPMLWHDLIQDRLAGKQDPDGYTWADVTESPLPEMLTLWHNGQIILTTKVNTGIAGERTALGSFDVYLRRKFQIMSGTNPNGSHYAVPVHWISYFHGSDALHGYLRAAYGFPQSLGCVEMPIPTAAKVWPYTHIGTVVTVQPTASS